MSANRHSDRAHLSLVDNEARGQEIKRRAFALGYNETKFADKVGMDRTTLRRAFAGGSRESAYVRLEEWLDREERRVGERGEGVELHASEDHVVFRFTGNFGVTAVVEGPTSDLPALREAAKDLFREMQRNAGPDEPSGE